ACWPLVQLAGINLGPKILDAGTRPRAWLWEGRTQRNPGVKSDEEDAHDQPSGSALNFGSASGLAATYFDRSANKTRQQLRLFVRCVWRLALDDVPPVQVGPKGGSGQADGRHVRTCVSRKGRGGSRKKVREAHL